MMSFELDPLATSSNDVLSTASLAPVFVQHSLTTSLTGLGEASQSLLFVDGSVADYEQLVAGVTPGTEIHVLDPLQDAVTQITNTLLGRQNITSLHIVSHGEAGGLDFGSSQLNLGNLPEYASQLQSWRNALSNDADILLYGCNVAQGELGQAFVQSISQVTGANVAASNNLTGYDGDWNLEVTIGNIESPLVFDSKVTSAYAYNLDNILKETFTGNDITNPSWIYNTTGTAPLLTARSTIGASTGGIPGFGSSPDAVGSGALRLTSADPDQASFVIYDRPINDSSGLSITFNIHSYGGDGADGISFFLIDGNASPTQAGAVGGSLGYSSDGTNPGLLGGYLGIGFDEYGNFSNTQYGAGGPVSGTGANSLLPDSIAVHGSQANSYNYLVGTETLTPGIDETSGNRPSAQKKVQIDLTPDGLLSVQIDLNNDGVFSGADEIPSALQNYNVVANNGALPSTFKFGFSASTGSQTNIHEITGLNVDTFGGVAYTPLVNFTSSSASVSEGAASLNLTAQIDVATSNTVTVPVTVSGTATIGTDYTLSNSTITILPGQLTGSITLNPINNSVIEPNKTVVVTLGTPTNAQLSPQNNLITAAIVDNDTNLVWRNSGTGQNAVWQLNNFSLQSDYFLPTVTDPNWQIASTADFNGDGIADILWRNQGSGQNVIWQMNRTGFQSEHYITQVPDANWQIVATDDFNGDRTPDILWRNRATGENVIWQMNSNFTLQSDYFITQVPDVNWQIAGTDDFNGDGTPDILWRNNQTAKEDIWQMNGFSLVQSYQLVDVIDPNWSVRPFVAA